MYWRFPSTWKDIDFRNRQNLINLLIENKTVEECFEEVKKIIRYFILYNLYQISKCVALI